MRVHKSFLDERTGIKFIRAYDTNYRDDKFTTLMRGGEILGSVRKAVDGWEMHEHTSVSGYYSKCYPTAREAVIALLRACRDSA